MNFLKYITIKPVYVFVAVLALGVILNAVGLVDFDSIDLGKVFQEHLQVEPLGVTKPLEPPVPTLVDDRTLPPAIEIEPEQTLEDFVVKVANYTSEHTLTGYGLVVEHNGKTLVLSSRMIRTRGAGAITVNDLPASVVAEDKTWGLIALEVYKGGLPAMPFEPADEAHEGEVTVVGEELITSSTGRSIRAPKTPYSVKKQWVILNDINARCVGAPVFAEDILVGLVVGRSQHNDTEAIAANVDVLKRLVKKAVGQASDES
jgi:hypothetical protein